MPPTLRRRTSLRRSPPHRKSQSPLAIAHDNLWAAFSLMIRERDNWTCFTYGTKVDPGRKTSKRQSQLYFDYTIQVLEQLTAAAKLSSKEYFIAHEMSRPKEVQEVQAKAA